MTSAAGPWPGPLSWTYDKIGNRLTEIRGGTGGYSDTYEYAQNTATPTPGNTAVLDLLNRGGGLLRDYTFDAGGYLTLVEASGNDVNFSFNEAGRLAQTSRMSQGLQLLDYAYDGRGFLLEALTPATDQDSCAFGGSSGILCDGFESGNTACWSSAVGVPRQFECPWKGVRDTVEATYSSAGLLHGLSRFVYPDTEQRAVLYFGSRPIALWKKVNSDPATVTYLTTDHLGSPILAMDEAGATIWSGGFEPFGGDYTVPSAEATGIFLRLPGQWDDPLFEDSTLGAEQYYNVHRWYEAQTARYSSVDPVGPGLLSRGVDIGHLRQLLGAPATSPRPYLYALASPLTWTDALGLFPCSLDSSTSDCGPDSGCCVGRCLQELRYGLCLAQQAMEGTDLAEGLWDALEWGAAGGVAGGYIAGPTGAVVGACVGGLVSIAINLTPDTTDAVVYNTFWYNYSNCIRNRCGNRCEVGTQCNDQFILTLGESKN